MPNKVRQVSRKLWRRSIGLLLALLALLLCGYGAFQLAVRWIPLPEGALAPPTPSVCFYAADGTLVHVRRGSDYQWNFPVSYEEIPPEFIRFVLAVEDRNFYRHHGFDCRSALRATRQLLTNGRIVSGASTITMQVMTMMTGRKRTLSYKIRQILLACKWEKTHSKEEILEYYFNHLPYGGKIYGIEAAAQYYFGRHVRELNRAEFTLLAGLPQNPTRLRPDRSPARAVQRRDVVLHLLQRAGEITPEEADEIRHEPLRYRRFGVTLWPQLADPQFLDLACAEVPTGSTECRLALDPEVQRETLTALRRGCAPLRPGVRDGAAVVIENATGRVRALVGTLDFDNLQDGKVNAAIAWRSPGSAWKPFLYGEAIAGGLLVAETRLRDEPLLLDDYRPANFDGAFRGGVSAAEALADSLNTPAVRLLRQLGVERMLRLLDGLHLLRPGVAKAPDTVGLSLAIGGTETTLLALAGAYARLAGAPERLSFLEETTTGEKKTPRARNTSQLWSPGVRALLLKMLRTRTLPGGNGLEAAWKTGTSNGNRDAWCIALTPKWTVAVWFGNKNGAADPALVGSTAAAPVAAEILWGLCQNDPPCWEESPDLEMTSLCAVSGLTPGNACQKRIAGTVVRGIPLAPCTRCGQKWRLQPRKKSPRIFSPQPGEYAPNAVDDDGAPILEVRIDTDPPDVHLYIDGEYRGMQHTGGRVRLPPGSHRITIWPGEEYDPKTITVVAGE